MILNLQLSVFVIDTSKRAFSPFRVYCACLAATLIGGTMKILIGMTRSDTMASGSFKHIVQIGEGFRRAGCEVAYVIGKRGPVCDFLSERGFQVFSLPSLERDLSPAKDFISLLGLLKILIQFNPDICSWHTAKIGALGRIASAMLFKRSFYVPHGIPFFESRHNSGYKKYRFLEKV